MTGDGGDGTRGNPWRLKTPPGTSEYEMYRDERADPPALVCMVGKTTLGYQLRCIEDLHAMLKQHGDWMPLGAADEQKPAAEGTVEAWGRSPDNPVGGLVRHEEGSAGSVWRVCTAIVGAAGSGRAGAQSAQQSYAGEVGFRFSGRAYLATGCHSPLSTINQPPSTQLLACSPLHCPPHRYVSSVI